MNQKLSQIKFRNFIEKLSLMKIAIFCAFDTTATIEYALATISYLEKKGHDLDLDNRLIEYISKPIDHAQFEASGTIN